MTTARDTHNQIEYAKEISLEEGLAKGRVIGRSEGLEEGREEERNNIVLKMLQNNLPVKTICDVTGLSMEEVLKLQKESIMVQIENAGEHFLQKGTLFRRRWGLYENITIRRRQSEYAYDF